MANSTISFVAMNGLLECVNFDKRYADHDPAVSEFLPGKSVSISQGGLFMMDSDKALQRVLSEP